MSKNLVSETVLFHRYLIALKKAYALKYTISDYTAVTLNEQLAMGWFKAGKSVKEVMQSELKEHSAAV